jgi:hypothetical protein
VVLGDIRHKRHRVQESEGNHAFIGPPARRPPAERRKLTDRWRMKTPKSPRTNRASGSSAAPGSAARVEECEDEFAAAWARGEEPQLRAALIALETALRNRIGTGPMQAKSLDTLDVGLVPPNVKGQP